MKNSIDLGEMVGLINLEFGKNFQFVGQINKILENSIGDKFFEVKLDSGDCFIANGNQVYPMSKRAQFPNFLMDIHR